MDMAPRRTFKEESEKLRFQLFLDTSDAELFSKATCELGTIFYKQIDGDGVKEPQRFEIVYFSGSRIVRYVGKADTNLVKLCRACGYEVDVIEIDDAMGTLKVVEKKETQ